MKSRLPSLSLWSLAGVLALYGAPGRAQNPDRPVALDAAPASPGGAAIPTQADNLPDLSSWTIPPIRWGGNTASTYVYNSDLVGTKSLTNTELVQGRASSFIYAPWFAQINANAGLNTTKAQNTSTNATSKASSTAFNYGGNVNLFPMSRFPFSAYFDSSDSRAKAISAGSGDAASTTQYNSLRLGARQTYRPETGNDNFNASADHSAVSSGAIRSVVNAFQGGYSTNYEDHGLGASAHFSSTSGDIGGQGSSLFGASGTHTWRIPEEGLTINNSLNYSRNDLKTLSTTGSGLILNNSQVLQASSGFNWIPDEDLPLTVGGGFGLLNTSTLTEAGRTGLSNFNGFANASYRINNNLTAMGGASIASSATTISNSTLGSTAPTVADVPARQTLLTQSASLSYSGDPLIFENFSYTWGGGANFSNQASSTGNSSRIFGGSGQHGINKTIPLSTTSSVALNATQSVGLNASSTSVGANSQNTLLNHTAGAVWRANVGQVSFATVSVNATDTMSTGTFSNHLRSFSGSGNFQTQLSARASLSASATVSASQQLSSPLTYTTTTTTFGTTTTTAPPTTWIGNGQISYNHRSPFDISNLVYTASFAANANQSNLRVVTGDPNALTWQVAKVFNNQATYRLGRLNFQATASFIWMGDGKKNATLFGSISRDIGDL